ncbi:hypothetical protein ACRASX_08265 [Flavobacterium sp. TMP13]|uniref:hypothetical protein n=1 Tax=unclassified Flavobacterium TaxID=196869 RepID=UPI00076BFB5F|nr:hypothetical protein [Flavobacterium sp. TAB 87]KVV15495.1 putative integral membrane protein [Flavobacterium sp. TAB 87]
MQPTTQNQIENIKNNGYELDFSTVFNHAIQNYKKIALYAGLILLVFSIVATFVVIGVLIAIYGVAALSGDLIQELAQMNPTGVTLLIVLAAQVFITAILSPIGAGYYKMADAAENDETFNVSTMFYYYKSQYFIQIFIATLLITSLSVVLSTILEQVGLQSATMVLGLLISFYSAMAVPLIIFGDLKAIDAIKGSIVIISKKPAVILGLIITAFLASMLGIFAFCIGVFFTIPFNYSMIYCIYSNIIKKIKIDPIDSIGTIEE